MVTPESWTGFVTVSGMVILRRDHLYAEDVPSAVSPVAVRTDAGRRAGGQA